MADKVKAAFDLQGFSIPIEQILPTKTIVTDERKNQTLRRLLASIPVLGLIEPLIVYPQRSSDGLVYTLLDGHVRLEAMRRLKFATVSCLISTEDETYTYNHKVCSVPPIHQHFMIMRAIDSGVPESRLAEALDLDIKSIRSRRDLLNGICPEAVDLLKDQHISHDAMREMRRVKPMRQIEMAELMLKSANYSTTYAKCLVAATSDEELVQPAKGKAPKGVLPDEVASIEKEMRALEANFMAIEQTHGEQVLNLVLSIRYLGTLLDNPAVKRFLSNKHPEMHAEFVSLVSANSLER